MWKCDSSYPSRIWDDDRCLDLRVENSRYFRSFYVDKGSKEYIVFSAYSKLTQSGGVISKNRDVLTWFVPTEAGGESVSERRAIIEEVLVIYRGIWGLPTEAENKYLSVNVIFDAPPYDPVD